MEHRFAGMRRGLVLASLISLIAAACGTSTPSAAPSAAPSQAAASQAAPSQVAITPPPIDTSAPGPNGGKVVRWFIGLGTGGKPDQIAAEMKVADDFNASQKEIYISVEIYDNRVASNQLQIEIAAGNPPDIIGPVGVEGLNIFRSQILDLSDLVTSQKYDMSKIDPKLVAMGKSMTLACAACHGRELAGVGGPAPDLRESPITLDPDAFYAVVHDGVLKEKGMPQFGLFGKLPIEAIRHYIRSEAMKELARQEAAKGKRK